MWGDQNHHNRNTEQISDAFSTGNGQQISLLRDTANCYACPSRMEQGCRPQSVVEEVGCGGMDSRAKRLCVLSTIRARIGKSVPPRICYQLTADISTSKMEESIRTHKSTQRSEWLWKVAHFGGIICSRK